MTSHCPSASIHVKQHRTRIGMSTIQRPTVVAHPGRWTSKAGLPEALLSTPARGLYLFVPRQQPARSRNNQKKKKTPSKDSIVPCARADPGPAHGCPRGLNLVFPRGQGLTSAVVKKRSGWSLEIGILRSVRLSAAGSFPARQVDIKQSVWCRRECEQVWSLIGMVSIRNRYAPTDTGSMSLVRDRSSRIRNSPVMISDRTE